MLEGINQIWNLSIDFKKHLYGSKLPLPNSFYYNKLMIKPAQIILALSLFSITSIAIADCEKGDKTVFSCTTEKQKIIEVCDSGKTINYSFGKVNLKPEIVVRTPRKEASTTQWQGFGRHMSNSIEIPNGNTVYSIFKGIDKIMEGDKKEPQVEAGVSVEINKKHITTVKCDNKKTLIDNIEGINLKATE